MKKRRISMTTRNLKPKAVKIARRVQKLLLDEPKRYSQETYCKRSDEAPCGTAACIAGWTDVARLGKPVTKSLVMNWLNKVVEKPRYHDDSYCGETKFGTGIHQRARKALGLNGDEANVLFTGDPSNDWPEPFSSRWNKAKTPRTEAKVAVALLEQLIKKGPSILHVWDAGEE